jgi:hypothetical protein
MPPILLEMMLKDPIFGKFEENKVICSFEISKKCEGNVQRSNEAIA